MFLGIWAKLLASKQLRTERIVWLAIKHGPWLWDKNTEFIYLSLNEISAFFSRSCLYNNILTSKWYLLSFNNHFLIFTRMCCIPSIYHHLLTQWWLLLPFRAKTKHQDKTNMLTKTKTTQLTVFSVKFFSLWNMAIFWKELRCFMNNLHPIWLKASICLGRDYDLLEKEIK